MDHLFVSYSSGAGGAERLLLDMAGGLPAPPALACPPGPLQDEARAAGMAVHSLRPRRLELRGSARDRAGGPLRIAGQAAEVGRLLRELRPRTVVAWNMRSLLSTAAALPAVRPRPSLVFQHNDFLPGPAIAAAVRAAAGRARLVICCSRAVAEELERGRLRPRFVHPGVDLERFGSEPPPAASQELLLLGAVTPWKRPELALEIVAIAARRLPHLRLTVAGAPLGAAGERLLARLRERARTPDLDGRVRFAGPLEDPRPALAAASCLLHCAEREPFGVALAEALATGRPVVAPAAGGPLEIVTGDCGRLYAPGAAIDAAEALVDLLGGERDPVALAQAARARAESCFELGDARRRYRELLEGA